jgi:hypothetical protein
MNVCSVAFDQSRVNIKTFSSSSTINSQELMFRFECIMKMTSSDVFFHYLTNERHRQNIHVATVNREGEGIVLSKWIFTLKSTRWTLLFQWNVPFAFNGWLVSLLSSSFFEQKEKRVSPNPKVIRWSPSSTLNRKNIKANLFKINLANDSLLFPSEHSLFIWKHIRNQSTCCDSTSISDCWTSTEIETTPIWQRRSRDRWECHQVFPLIR